MYSNQLSSLKQHVSSDSTCIVFLRTRIHQHRDLITASQNVFWYPVSFFLYVKLPDWTAFNIICSSPGFRFPCSQHNSELPDALFYAFCFPLTLLFPLPAKAAASDPVGKLFLYSWFLSFNCLFLHPPPAILMPSHYGHVACLPCLSRDRLFRKLLSFFCTVNSNTFYFPSSAGYTNL